MTSDPTKCTVLYKILTPDEHAGLPTSDWKGTSLDLKDGFVHLSTSSQVPLTLERFFNKDFFPGDDLVLGFIPRSSIDVDDKLKFDESAHGDRFGHVYGTIDPSKDFVKEIKIARESDGKFLLPELDF
ncbi:hypothetical protein FFLO_00887 [Filobasidium floriforme]|uniref:DUF952 domain-containing protein n=1 Tax=Filobasidium floriforme TaxID=5210 RepID=A0A8K0JRH4_9TREE|nr:uncharacterized protein HD553DRAFT_341026 [Filobasidium floriforme]KAG7571214.1 hypothetical protein FFLO_00887 [Filobasidium floriforme]KAH8087053.1 hypothetical protein HD553DRAFT_341026 [Filobasidium floriforme]